MLIAIESYVWISIDQSQKIDTLFFDQSRVFVEYGLFIFLYIYRKFLYIYIEILKILKYLFLYQRSQRIM